MKTPMKNRIFPTEAHCHRTLRLERLEGRWMLSADTVDLFQRDALASHFQRQFHQSDQVSERRDGNERRQSNRDHSHREGHLQRYPDQRARDRFESNPIIIDLVFASRMRPSAKVDLPALNRTSNAVARENTSAEPSPSASTFVFLVNLNGRASPLRPNGEEMFAAASLMFQAATSTEEISANEPAMDGVIAEQTLVSVAPANVEGGGIVRPAASEIMPDIAQVLHADSPTFESQNSVSPNPDSPELDLAEVDRWLDDAESLRGKFDALDRALEQLSEQHLEEGSIDLPPAPTTCADRDAAETKERLAYRDPQPAAIEFTKFRAVDLFSG